MVMNHQYSTREGGEVPIDTMYIGKESLSERRSQEARYKRGSMTRRQDSQGRGSYKRYERFQSLNRNRRSQSCDRRGFYTEHSQLRSGSGEQDQRRS